MSRSIQLRGAASLLLSTTALVGFLTAGAALATNTAAVDAQALTTVEPEEVGLGHEADPAAELRKHAPGLDFGAVAKAGR